MSYRKNAVIKHFSLSGLGKIEGSSRADTCDAQLGGNITTVLVVDYGESITEPAIWFKLRFVAKDGVITDLRLRGTERASLEIEHPSSEESLKFDDLVVTQVQQGDSTSTANIFDITLNVMDAINNEKNRVSQKFKQGVKASTHVTNIIENHIKTDFEVDVEDTANSDGFYGNFWRPYRAITFLAKRAVSKSMPEDGGSTDRVGFLFWQTKSKVNFKSIDTIIDDGKSDPDKILKFTQNEVVDPDSIEENYNIFNPSFETNSNLLDYLNNAWGRVTQFFNTQTLLHGTDLRPKSDTDDSQATLGSRESLDPSVIGETPLVGRRTLRVNGTIEESGQTNQQSTLTNEFNPEQITDQANIRYRSLMTHSLVLSVPYNLSIEAGDIINIKLIQSNRGTDPKHSGLYMVRDLRHNIQTTENGVECLTHLRVVRDTEGDID